MFFYSVIFSPYLLPGFSNFDILRQFFVFPRSNHFGKIMPRFAYLVFTGLLLAVCGCSSSISSSPKPAKFEDAFRKNPDTGTPMFNKVPYVNRLFMNSGGGSDRYVWDNVLDNTTAIVSPDGNWLLTGHRTPGAIAGHETIDFNWNQGIVSLWSLTDPEKHQRNLVPDDGSLASVDWLAFMPDSSQFFVFQRPSGNYRPGTLKRYDRATGKELQVISDSLIAPLGAVSPNGQYLVASTPNSVEVWNAVDGQMIGSIPFGATVDVESLRFSPDGHLLFVGCWGKGIHVFDLRQGKLVTIIPTVGWERDGFSKTCMAVSPDGKTLLVIDRQDMEANPKCRMRLIEIGSWRPLREFEPMCRENTVHDIQTTCFSPDGDKLYGFGFQRTKTKGAMNTEIKSFLGEFDLSRENRTWTEISYETLPLHPIGKQLLSCPDSGAAYLSKFYEKMGVDFSIKFKKD